MSFVIIQFDCMFYYQEDLVMRDIPIHLIYNYSLSI